MTKCPTCGTDASDSATRCAVCATDLSRRVGTAVLTPPARPGSAPDAETVGGAPFPSLSAAVPGATLVPGQSFGHRYQIISVLGVGGMGAVYHVWDSALGLSLALKVIRPDTDPMAAQELERRFKRELVLARQVTHHNVIRIHDLGEIDGVKYITMPFVHGTDLARLLQTEGRLPVARALLLARQMISGLRAAHEQGIVHRDFKPANILIDEADKAIITDFGIARSTDPGTFATAAGSIIGTLAYMAPEQATGQPVDQRADIYAFGLIFSEMLVGRRGSNAGDTALARLIERSRQAPPRLRALDPSIPEPLDRIVARCLEPEPAARYQTTAELEADLAALDPGGLEYATPVKGGEKSRSSWLPLAVAALALVVLVVGAVSFFGRGGDGEAPAAAPRRTYSVLVADFANQANDPVFDGALEQVLSIAIEGASFISSTSRASAKALVTQLNAGATLDESNARLVAAREGTDLVLAGVVSPRDRGYQVAVKAVDPINGQELARRTADAPDKPGVLTAVQTVASQLRQDLGDTTPESARRAPIETVTAASLDALRSYSLAQDLSSSGRQEESIKHYEEAIAADPEFGRAYSGMATVLYNLGRRDEAERRWKEALQHMERMTERERYRTLGLWFLAAGASYRQARENFEKLVAAYPVDRAGQSNLAVAHFQLLDFQKAIEHGRKAVDLYPKSPRYRMNYAIYAMFVGDSVVAEEQAKAALELNKTQHKAYLPLAAVAFANTDLARMRDMYREMQATGAVGASLATHGLADLALYQERVDEAERLLREGIQADAKRNVPLARAGKLVLLAEVHLAANRQAEAVRAAQEAMSYSREESILVPATLVLVRAGRRAEAQTVATELLGMLQERSRAYGEIIQGELARTSGRYVEAKEAFERAQALADMWLVRLLLGITYVQSGNYPAAQPELALADKRRGEASAVFFDDVPSFRMVAHLPYWIGRMQEGINKASPSATENYRKFLSIRSDTSRDPLALDARKRLSAPPR